MAFIAERLKCNEDAAFKILNKKLKENGLDRRYVLIYLLHAAGYKQEDIARRIQLSQSQVCQRIKKLKGIFPGLFEQRKDIPDLCKMLPIREDDENRVVVMF